MRRCSQSERSCFLMIGWRPVVKRFIAKGARVINYAFTSLPAPPCRVSVAVFKLFSTVLAWVSCFGFRRRGGGGFRDTATKEISRVWQQCRVYVRIPPTLFRRNRRRHDQERPYFEITALFILCGCLTSLTSKRLSVPPAQPQIQV